MAKSSLEKEFEALGIGNEFELLLQQAHEEEEMEDKLIEDMVAVSEGGLDDVALFVPTYKFKVELKGVTKDIHGRLDTLGQGLQKLNMCELRDDLQKLQEQIVATLLQRKEDSEATDRSFGKGSGEEDAAIILSSSPPIKPTETLNKSQDVIANIVTPEAATNPDAKTILHSNKPTKLLQKTKNYNSGFPTIHPTKLSTNLPTKVLKVNVIKPSTNEAKVSTYNQDQLFH